MVIDYVILLGNTVQDLNVKVKALIAEGWQPLGAPIMVGQAPAQAMVKPKPQEDEA